MFVVIPDAGQELIVWDKYTELVVDALDIILVIHMTELLDVIVGSFIKMLSFLHFMSFETI